MEQPIQVPVLQVHGEQDPALLVSSVQGSDEFADDYRLEVMDGVGHFPHEEAPQRFSALLRGWLPTVS
jgi:pimeloyl-ACP methyl ester carboxylesterase